MAKWFSVPVETITWVLRVAVIVAPLAAGAVTYWLMNAYKLSGAPRFTKVPLVYFKHPRKPLIPRGADHTEARSPARGNDADV